MGALCSLDGVASCFSQHKLSSNLSSFTIDRRRSSNALTIKDFKRKMLLGKGSYGKVLLVKKKDTNEAFAMKIIKKKDIKDYDCIKMERKVMLENKSPFIVHLNYALQDDSHVAFVMEYLEGGDLLTCLNDKRKKRSFQYMIRFYLAEIVCALEHLHQEMNILYGDLKPTNILLDGEGHAKLIDFGSSIIVEKGKKINGLRGSPNYIAPEIVLGVEYDQQVDIWSLGCSVYELLLSHPPFEAKNYDALYQKIVEEEPSFPLETPTVLKELILGMMNKNPSKRLTIEKIKHHEYFYGLNWNDVVEKRLATPISLKLNTSEDDDDCTASNSSYIASGSQRGLSNLESLNKQIKTDLDIEKEFEDLFPDYTVRSFRSVRSVERLP